MDIYRQVVVDGYKFVCLSPRRVADWIDWDVRIMPDIKKPHMAVAALDWVDRWVKTIDSKDCTRVQLVEAFDDVALGVMDLVRSLFGACRLPKEISQGLIDYHEVILGADEYDPEFSQTRCECRFCRRIQDERDDTCRYFGLSDYAAAIAFWDLAFERPEFQGVELRAYEIARIIDTASQKASAAVGQRSAKERDAKRRMADIQRRHLGMVIQ